MWFKSFFYNCLDAFLSLFSVIGGGAYDYNGSWVYVPIGIVAMIIFFIGCIQIIKGFILFLDKLPKIHRKKIVKRVSWRDDK